MASPEIMQTAVALVSPEWTLETLNELVVAGMVAGAPAGLEWWWCGLPPDVSLQLSHYS